MHRVRREVDPLYHRVIDEFRKLSGVGAVLNTSFNISEPIITTPGGDPDLRSLGDGCPGDGTSSRPTDEQSSGSGRTQSSSWRRARAGLDPR